MATALTLQSSRGLERECGSNIALIWLAGRLPPDFKTIANFHKNNGPAIRNVCRQLTVLGRNLHLLDELSVAIDGSKLKALNARKKNFTLDRLKLRIATIDNKIERDLSELNRADRQQKLTGVPAPAAKTLRLTEGI